MAERSMNDLKKHVSRVGYISWRQVVVCSYIETTGRRYQRRKWEFWQETVCFVFYLASKLTTLSLIQDKTTVGLNLSQYTAYYIGC